MQNAKPQNIPCPFIRALVAQNYIEADIEPVQRLAELIGEAAGGSEANKAKIRTASKGIAAIANGLRPDTIYKTYKGGLRIEKLRGGPLDKRGVNSRIIDQTGKFNPEQFERLKAFAREFTSGEGKELGIGLSEIKKMMDENAARASHKRPVDRLLMEGEWPVLLKVMKKGEGDAAYLSLDELRTLFAERRFPARIEARIASFRLPT